MLSCKEVETSYDAQNHTIPCPSGSFNPWSGPVSLAQSNALEHAVKSVAAFYDVSEGDVLDSETWKAEAFLVGSALRVIGEPGKAVPSYQPLPGSPDESIETRVLASNFRPVAGEFTWFQTAEGSFVVLPSKERFDVLYQRSKFFKQ